MSDCRKCAEFDWCVENEDCGLFKPKPQTNYDRIISKTPYELADWIAKILDHCENKMPNELCRQSCPLYKCCNDQPGDNIEDWLKAKVEVKI